jgi:cell wall-associated NlpC family hydrolase
LNRAALAAALAAALVLILSACVTVPRAPSGEPIPPGAAAPGSSQPPAAESSAGYGNLIVDGATAMLGQPYRFGGAAPGGFDCSGLVVYAAGGAGIHVPRTAREQLSAGVRIGRAEVRAGDLVFMHLAHKELHVGIAIDNDKFVHAPSTGGRVRIDSLNAPPYSKGFFLARRIAPDR